MFQLRVFFFFVLLIVFVLSGILASCSNVGLSFLGDTPLKTVVLLLVSV